MEVRTYPICMKIFLVDDSPLICERLEALLNVIPGVRVVGAAATPGDALVGIARSGAQVAIIDMQLKRGNGLAVLKGLSARSPRVVPIMLTNNATEQLEQQCRRDGAQFFFDKAMDFNQVRDAIKVMVTDQPAHSEEVAMMPL